MDRTQEEELTFLSCGGIFKLICQWKKIFSQITLTLIVPLFIVVFGRLHISVLLFNDYFIDSHKFDHPDNSNNQPGFSILALYALFQIVYFTLFIIFSLFSTAAVVYTIACIYTHKEITFKSIISVVPYVWKRLLLTFIIGYAFFFVFFVVGLALLAMINVLIIHSPIGTFLILVSMILFVSGLVYISIIWSMASVVSVLEEANGINAMKKAKELIKGHIGVSIGLSVLQSIAFGGISFVYEVVVMVGDLNLGMKLWVGFSCFGLFVIVLLLVLVIQTVIYFVCKSYHQENVDRTSLADHLETYYSAYGRVNGVNEVNQIQPPVQTV